ncbi:TULIP family P47-like protein [Variovorax sp. dw_308]|uniref:TULIP family P47-like protein n=1 Tax=Variovorax sp. dw_308 TaxID=2721546 RepID=UPI001C4678AF|nr:TULIP family P47-like protein [Variovorax sp. dw_308]
MATPASTYGWDIVFATRTSVVNAGLIDPGPQPFDETVVHGGTSVHAVGSTGRWQVTVGGSGALVNFSVPCTTLTLGNGDKTVQFADGQFEVQGRLELAPAVGGIQQIVIATALGAVTVLVASFRQPGFEAYAAYATSAFQQWLDAQASLPYVLATVALRGPGASGLGAALAPVSASYAYADATGGGGVLGVLGTVTDPATSGTQLLQEVSPDAVTATDTALLVSAAVLQQLVDGAASAVKLPGTPGSACTVHDTVSFNVVTKGTA